MKVAPSGRLLNVPEIGLADVLLIAMKTVPSESVPLPRSEKLNYVVAARTGAVPVIDQKCTAIDSCASSVGVSLGKSQLTRTSFGQLPRSAANYSAVPD